MNIVNFPAIVKNRGILTQDQIDLLKDLLLVGKFQGRKVDFEQYISDAIPIQDFINLVISLIPPSPGAAPLVPSSYTNFLTLINTSTLVPGQNYVITDFATRHYIPNAQTDPSTPAGVLNTGGIEPLIVQAATVNTIHAEAISTLNPTDELLYEVVDSTTAGGNKGRIFYRKDTKTNNTAHYDWRVVLFRRWIRGSIEYYTTWPGVIVEYIIQDYYTFSNEASPTIAVAHGNYIGPVSTTFKSDGLNNIVIGTSAGKRAMNNVFGNDCFDNTFESETSPQSAFYGIGVYDTGNTTEIPGNQFGNAFIGNTIFKGSFWGNTFKGYTQNNIFRYWTANNTFGSYILNNIFCNYFEENSVDSWFEDNIFLCDGGVYGSSFGLYNTNNTIGSIESDAYIGDCVFGNGWGYNTFIGTDFSVNNTSFGNDCTDNVFRLSNTQSMYANTFENDCRANIFGNSIPGEGFSSNISCDLRYNHFENNFQSNSFLGVPFNGDNDFNSGVRNNHFGPKMISNTFRNMAVVANEIGAAFKNNQFGQSVTLNAQARQFYGNKIGAGSQLNVGTGDSVYNNNISNNFSSNTNIGTDFRNNTINTDTSVSVSYAASTHVYGTYSTVSYKDAGGTNRITYVDAVGVLITTPLINS